MGSSRANAAFIIPLVVALAVFAAIVLPGDSLSLARFGVAALAFMVIAPGGAWVLMRIPEQ
jgi:hypothetical protein